jgi:hypothetical protein
MATITQVPGQLNVQSTRNQAISFACNFSGDLTTSTFVATLLNGATTVTLSNTVVYDGSTTTAVTITLSAAQAATLTLADYNWQLIQTTSGIARTVLAGNWEIVNGY